MSRARFFTTEELPTGDCFAVPLSTEDAKHAARVLRIMPGEELDLVAPSGAGWRVRVTQVAHHGLLAERICPLVAGWHPEVSLFQGVAKGEKMDMIVRQAVEVGAIRIVPVETSRTVVKFDERKRLDRGERWRRIALSAAKQARRDEIPAVADPATFDEMLGLLGGFDATVVLWEDEVGRSLGGALRPLLQSRGTTIALVVGPEGGLSADEISRLRAAGAITATLGPSVLRTETAAVVATALCVAYAYEADETRDE